MKSKNWVRHNFSSTPDSAAPFIPFKPTVIMELNHNECPIHHCRNKHNYNCRHAFIINYATIINKQIVFYVSSYYITPTPTPSDNKKLKLIKTIPTGHFHKARFDIDCSFLKNLYKDAVQHCSSLYTINSDNYNDCVALCEDGGC
jgi:hypothetical protein